MSQFVIPHPFLPQPELYISLRFANLFTYLVNFSLTILKSFPCLSLFHLSLLNVFIFDFTFCFYWLAYPEICLFYWIFKEPVLGIIYQFCFSIFKFICIFIYLHYCLSLLELHFVIFFLSFLSWKNFIILLSFEIVPNIWGCIL